MNDKPMTARQFFLQLTDPTNWSGDEGPGYKEAMEVVHEGCMEFWDELESTVVSDTDRLDWLERDRHKLLQMCERAYSICMGDCEPSDMDDWVTDYNETKREISLQNVESIHPESKP
jgi:hypothetical protein